MAKFGGSVRATLGGKDVRKARKQTRPSSTPPSTSVNATLGGKGVREARRQLPFRRKAIKLRRRIADDTGVPPPKGEVEREIRERRVGERVEQVLREHTEKDSPADIALKYGSIGQLDKESTPKEAAVFAAETLALGAAGKAIGAGVKAAKATKAGKAASKATSAAKAAPSTAVKKAATKAPKPVKSAAGTATRAAKKVAKSKPGKAVKVGTAPVRYPLKKAAEHPGKTTLASIGGPGAVEAGKTGDTSKATAPFVGTAKALTRPRTYATTLHTLPSLVTAPVGIAANVGLSGYRATQSAIPGGKHYSGKEITAPVKSSGEEIEKFAKHYADVYGSGDPDKIAKATEEEFGVGMALPALGALRRGGKIDAAVGKIPPVRTRRLKRVDSRDTARAHRKGQKHAEEAANPVLTEARKGPGKRDHRGSEVKVLAEEGIDLKNPKRAVEQLKNTRRSYGERPADDARLPHDVLDELIANPKRLENKHLRKAVESYKKQAKEIETSRRAKHFNQAITHDIKLPEERFAERVQKDAALAKALKQEEKRLEAEGITAEQGNLFDPGTPEFEHLKKPLKKKLREYDAQAEAAFLKEVEGVRKKHGLTEPAYTKDVDLLRKEFGLQSGKPYPIRTSSKQHFKAGAVRAAGVAEQSLENLIQSSVYEPRMRRAIHEDMSRFVEQAPESIGGKRYMTSKEIREAKFDPKKYAVLDSQHFKQAVLDPRTDVSDLVKYGNKALANEILERDVKAKAGVRGDMGKKYVVIEKKRLENKMAQYEGLTGKLEKGFAKSQRVASTALLGYSPSWLIAQPIAETAQALAAVGPVNMLRAIPALRKFKREDPEGFREFAGSVGSSAGVGAVHDTAIAMKGDVMGARYQVAKKMRQTAPGRFVHGVLSGRFAANFDRRKGNLIRETMVAGHMIREYNSLRAALKGSLKMGDDLSRELKGMKPHEQLSYVAKNPKVMAKLEGYADDTMGNWSALTANERIAASVVVFYPFVRMSLEWTALSFPKRHPMKASIHHFLAQQNAQQVENLAEGKPSFFTQWASAPLYAGRGKELGEPTSKLPFGRIAPGSNAFVEATGQGQKPRALLRGLNPFVGGLFAAIGNYDPQTGRNLGEKYESPSFGDALRNFTGAAASLPAPVRFADKVAGGKPLRKLKGKSDSYSSKAYKQLEDNPLLRAAIPFVPENTARELEKAELSRLVNRAYDMDDDYGHALERARKAVKEGKGGAAEDEIVKVLDALVARNQLDKYYESKGITSAEDSEQVKNLAGAQMPNLQIPRTWNQILEDAQDAGIDYKRVIRKRKRRARSLMGNQ